MDIEKIKLRGEIEALKATISDCRHRLQNKLFEGYMSDGIFVSLGDDIQEAISILADMKMLLNALQEIEPENK